MNEHVGITLDVLPGTLGGITAALGGFNELVGAASMLSTAIGRSSDAITSMTLTAGLAIAGLGYESAKAAGEVERAMKIVQSVSGQTSSQISVLTQQASEFSVKYKMGIDEITDGLVTLGRAGLSSVNTQLDTMKAGLEAAKVTGLELDEVLNKIVQTTSLLGGDINSSSFGQQTQDMTTKLLATSQTAPIDMNDVVQTLSYSGGTAAAGGINIYNEDALYDYLGAIAAFGQKGVKGSMAGTALRAFFTKPASQTSQVTEALGALNMKPTDLWTDGGNKMRPVSEQIGLIQKQMDKLKMSQIDQIELWGKIVSPKMGQQMLKLNQDSIRDLSAKIKETDSAEQLAENTMQNFLSDLKMLGEQGQKAWRELGETALAWIHPVVKGLNGLMNILGQDVGGFPIFQQIIKGAIILVISQVIQKLGTAWSLIKGIANELKNQLQGMSQRRRTEDEVLKSLQAEYQAMGLTEQQAKTLAMESQNVRSGISASTKVLGEFLAKLNEAVALMTKLSVLSQAQSLGAISSISSAQHNRLFNNAGSNLKDSAWFDGANKNRGFLTKNEFSTLALRHGMDISNAEGSGLLDIYKSSKFQKFAKENQGSDYNFPTAISLEKYLQEHEKGLYDKTINPIVAVAQQVKTDTGNIATNVSTLSTKKDVSQIDKTKSAATEARLEAKKQSAEVKNTATEVKVNSSKIEQNARKTMTDIQSRMQIATSSIKGYPMSINRTVGYSPFRAIQEPHMTEISPLALAKAFGTRDSIDKFNLSRLQVPQDYINDYLKTTRAFYNRTKGYAFMSSSFAQRESGLGGSQYFNYTPSNTRKRLDTQVNAWEATQQKLKEKLSQEERAALEQELQVIERRILREEEILTHIDNQRQILNTLESKFRRIDFSVDRYGAAQDEAREAIQEALKPLKEQKSVYEHVNNVFRAELDKIEKELKKVEKDIASAQSKRKPNEDKINALKARQAELEEQKILVEDDILAALTMLKDTETSINTLAGIEKTTYINRLDLYGSELLLEEEKYNNLVAQYDAGTEILKNEDLIEQALRGDIGAIDSISKTLQERKNVENSIIETERGIERRLRQNVAGASGFSTVPGFHAGYNKNEEMFISNGKQATNDWSKSRGYMQPIGPQPNQLISLVNANMALISDTHKHWMITEQILNEAYEEANIQSKQENAKALAERKRTATRRVRENPALASQSTGYNDYLQNKDATDVLAHGYNHKELQRELMRQRARLRSNTAQIERQLAPLQAEIDEHQQIRADLLKEKEAIDKKILIHGRQEDLLNKQSSLLSRINTTDESILLLNQSYEKEMKARLARIGPAAAPGVGVNTPGGMYSRYSMPMGQDALNKMMGGANPAPTFSEKGIFGRFTSGYLQSISGMTNYDENRGFWGNWARNSGLLSMVNFKKIDESLAESGKDISKLGKVSAYAGGALSSLSMMFGPIEMGLMALSLIMQGLQVAYQNYQKELEEINSALSEAREKIKEAEESFLSAYEEANPKATQDEKDEALLDAYAGDTSASKDDGLQSYRDKLYGQVAAIEVNTRQKAEKEQHPVWGESGDWEKYVGGRTKAMGGWLSLVPIIGQWGALDARYSGDVFKEWREELQTKARAAETLELDKEGWDSYRSGLQFTDRSGWDLFTGNQLNSAESISRNMEKSLDISIEKLDGTLNHYPEWIDQMDDKSDNAKYARSIMAEGIDRLGPTKDDAYKGIWGSNNDVAQYYRMQSESMQLSNTDKTNIMNAINDNEDFFTKMQKLYFKDSKDGKLVGRDNKTEQKILKAIQNRLGNISNQQAKIAFTLAAVSQIQKVVSEQVQPTLMSHMEAAWQGVSITSATGDKVGGTWNTTSAVQQGVAVISAQMARLLQQKAVELGSLQAEMAGIDMKDLDALRQADSGRGITINGHGYSAEDVYNAKQIYSAIVTSPYEAVALQRGDSVEEARAFGERMKGLLEAEGRGLLAIQQTQAKGLQYFLNPVITDAYINSMKDSDAKATGPADSGKDKDKNKDKDSSANRKNWVNLAICNKKEIPKLNVNLFKKPPNFTILNRNFKLRDVNVNTADDAKSIQNAVKNSIIEIQNRSNPKIIQDDAAEYDPVNATEGGKDIPTGTRKTE